MSLDAYVAALVVDLHFPEAGSLKAKRKELSSLKGQLRSRLGVAVAEVDHQDVWQRSTLLVTLASGSLQTLSTASDEVERFVEARHPDGVAVERLIASVEELRG